MLNSAKHINYLKWPVVSLTYAHTGTPATKTRPLTRYRLSDMYGLDVKHKYHLGYNYDSPRHYNALTLTLTCLVLYA